MNTFSATLLSNESATGDYIKWPGGRGEVRVDGTFGGATLTLQIKSPDGSSVMTVGTNTTFTAEGIGGFDLGPCDLKMGVSGGTPSALYSVVTRVPS